MLAWTGVSQRSSDGSLARVRQQHAQDAGRPAALDAAIHLVQRSHLLDGIVRLDVRAHQRELKPVVAPQTELHGERHALKPPGKLIHVHRLLHLQQVGAVHVGQLLAVHGGLAKHAAHHAVVPRSRRRVVVELAQERAEQRRVACTRSGLLDVADFLNQAHVEGAQNRHDVLGHLGLHEFLQAACPDVECRDTDAPHGGCWWCCACGCVGTAWRAMVQPGVLQHSLFLPSRIGDSAVQRQELVAAIARHLLALLGAVNDPCHHRVVALRVAGELRACHSGLAVGGLHIRPRPASRTAGARPGA